MWWRIYGRPDFSIRIAAEASEKLRPIPLSCWA